MYMFTGKYIDQYTENILLNILMSIDEFIDG